MPEQLELKELDRFEKVSSDKFKKIIVICPHPKCKTKGEIVVSKKIVLNNHKLTNQ